MPRTALVGRDGELATLAGWLDAAGAGEPRLVLCGGEPGVGKTRLAEELTRVARDRDVPVLWGRAMETDGAPPYWPWRQMLRAAGWATGVGRTAEDQRVAANVSGLVARAAEDLGVAGDLAMVAPEVFPGLADAAALSGPEQRFRVFEAVTRFLCRLAVPRGLLLVLDDLHWADRASVLLLGHLVRDLEPGRLLLLATYRDTEPALTSTVADLIREPVTSRLELSGLALAEVGQQLAAITGGPVAPELAARVHELTGGNPFFVGELARTVGGNRIPTTIVEAIRRRMDRLSPQCRHQLRAAAIVGREFSVALVAAVIGRPVLRCLEPLEEAVAAGLVEPAETPGRHRFVHALVRDAVEGGLLIGKQRARRERPGRRHAPARWWSTFLRWTVGYGYAPARIFPWFIGLLLVGWALFAGPVKHSLVATDDAAKAQDFDPFLYVIDLLLPVASLGVRSGWTATGVAQWLVVALTLAGWLLGLTLVAAISGAFKRD